MITIELPFPPAKLSGHNNGSWLHMSPLIKKHRQLAYAEALSAHGRHLRLGDGDILIAIHFYPPDKRGDRVNFANRMKPYLDGIADALGVNDKRFLPSYHFYEADKKRPRVEVAIGTEFIS